MPETFLRERPPLELGGRLRVRFNMSLGRVTWRATAVLAAVVVAGPPFGAGLAGQEEAGDEADEAVPAAMVLLVSGGVRDGRMTLGPAFAYEGSASPTEESGAYELRGLDGEGTVLFRTRLTPGEMSDGGSGFTIVLPFEAAWTETLDRIELRGPEGVATLDRSDGARAMLIRDRETGQVRAILRDAPASGGLPPSLAADSARLEIIRGLPRPPS